ncbi:MAG: LytTR family DNA-binding domain-containing protein [Clostridia bacterium]|nr:LytTR family DNA-binding domain-containing protein [Clostridia bacterium]
MKIAICDDEKMFVEKIEDIVQESLAKYDDECEFVTCNCGSELIEICLKERIDVVFLDIVMPEMDGFKIAEKLLDIRENVVLVFVSSKEEMVYLSYEYRPFWFVPKSQLQMLKHVMEKIIRKYEYEKNKVKSVPICIEGKIIEINLSEVMYLKTFDHYIKIADKNKGESKSYRCKMTEIEKQLVEVWFVRSHNRYLVNCRSISYLKGSKCVLLTGEEVPISRSRIVKVREVFQNYMRSER